MNLRSAYRQLETQELLSLLTAIDRTRARHNIPNPIGGGHFLGRFLGWCGPAASPAGFFGPQPESARQDALLRRP